MARLIKTQYALISSRTHKTQLKYFFGWIVLFNFIKICYFSWIFNCLLELVYTVLSLFINTVNPRFPPKIRRILPHEFSRKTLLNNNLNHISFARVNIDRKYPGIVNPIELSVFILNPNDELTNCCSAITVNLFTWTTNHHCSFEFALVVLPMENIEREIRMRWHYMSRLVEIVSSVLRSNVDGKNN